MRRRKFKVADLLCGAGGSSTGCKRALDALGLEMELVCVNHWGVAIETHKKNHPEARHYVQDISTVRPHLIVPEGYLDLLMASPTCTHHSVARGGKPTSDQQRSDPWHIITWLTELRVKRIIIENVWEFIGWGPVDPKTGKPIKARKGEYFQTWIDTIRRLGFEPEWHKLNAADFGDATTRQRFILMARSDGRRVVWPVPTHHKRSDNVTLFAGQHTWKPAREIIDWGIKGKSIFNRKKPLAPKTLARIYAGAVKFAWPEPFLVILRNHMAGQSVDAPLPTIAANGTHIGLAEPILLANRTNNIAKSADDPAPTFTTAHGGGIAVIEPFIVKQNFRRDTQSVDEPAPTIMTEARIGVAEPVIVRTDMHKSNAQCIRGADDPLATMTTTGGVAVAEPVIINGRKGNKAKGVSSDPVPTLDTKGGVWLAEPLILSQHNSGAARAVGEPLPTITTGGAAAPDHPGCARPMLAEPVIVRTNMHGRKSPGARGVSDPLMTFTTDGGIAVVEPFIISTAHGNAAGERDPNHRRSKSIDDPLGAIHAGGGNFAVAEPLILNRNSAPRGETRPVSEPAPTPTTSGGGYLIEPFVLSRQGGGATRAVAEPVPGLTAKHSHVLVAPYYGTGSGETCHTADEPLPTVTSKGRFGMVVPITHAGQHRARDIDDEPIPTITTANRGELAFITAQHGERVGQAPRVHSMDQPTPTIAATGHVDLVEGTPEYDILFRMLEAHELAAAMGFNTVDQAYEFAGTKTEQIKQIGNAVSVAKMKACVLAIAADAAVRRKPMRGAKARRAA